MLLFISSRNVQLQGLMTPEILDLNQYTPFKLISRSNPVLKVTIYSCCKSYIIHFQIETYYILSIRILPIYVND